MRGTFFTFFMVTSLLGCAQENCVEHVNLLPMYGHVEKCKEQIRADKKFLADCDSSFPNRDSAYKYYLVRGWQYLHADSLSTSMKRFNQAWLLDSTKIDAYWGFAVLTGKKGDFEGSIRLFRKALSTNKTDEKSISDGNLWRDAALSYGNYFYKTKQKNYLDTGIQYLRYAIQVAPRNPMAYRDLAISFHYEGMVDSARKYARIVDEYDSTILSNDFRELIK